MREIADDDSMGCGCICHGYPSCCSPTPISCRHCDPGPHIPFGVDKRDLRLLTESGWRVVWAPNGLGTGPAEEGFVEWKWNP